MIHGVIMRQALSACGSKSGIDVVRHFPSANRRANTGSFPSPTNLSIQYFSASLSSKKSTEG